MSFYDYFAQTFIPEFNCWTLSKDQNDLQTLKKKINKKENGE